MASVYRAVGANGKTVRTWTAAFYVPDSTGRKVLRRKSTGLQDRKQALAVAVAWERAGQLAGAGRLTQARAREILSEIAELTGGERIEEFTARAWLTNWLELKRGNASARTVERYRGVIDKFLDYLEPRRREQSLEHVTSADVAGFLRAQLDAGRAPHSVNLQGKILKQAFAAAVRRGVLKANPCAVVEPFRDPGGEGRAPFTLEELRRILDMAEGEWRGLILAGLYTGLRLGDATRLKWGAVDLKAAVIRVRPQKTAARGKELVIPLAPPLREYLSTLTPPVKAAEAPVFSSLSRRRLGGSRGLSLEFKRIMAAAGVEGGVSRERGGAAGRTVFRRSFHSLRHTLNSILHNSGVSQELRQRILGHASPAMNNKYTHTDVETLRAALAAVPAVGLNS